MLPAKLKTAQPDAEFELTDMHEIVPELDSFVSDLFSISSAAEHTPVDWSDLNTALLETVKEINNFKSENLFSLYLAEDVPVGLRWKYTEDLIESEMNLIEANSNLEELPIESGAGIVRAKLLLAGFRLAVNIQEANIAERNPAFRAKISRLHDTAQEAIEKNNKFLDTMVTAFTEEHFIPSRLERGIPKPRPQPRNPAAADAVKLAAIGEFNGDESSPFPELRRKYESFVKGAYGFSAKELLGGDPATRMESLGEVKEGYINSIIERIDAVGMNAPVNLSFDWMPATLQETTRRLMETKLADLPREFAAMEESADIIEHSIAEIVVRNEKLKRIESECSKIKAEIDLNMREFAARRDKLESMGEIVELDNLDDTFHQMESEYAELKMFKTKFEEDPSFAKSSFAKVAKQAELFDRKASALSRQLKEHEHVSANVKMLIESAKNYVERANKAAEAAAKALDEIPPGYSAETIETIFKLSAKLTIGKIFAIDNKTALAKKGVSGLDLVETSFDRMIRAFEDYGFEAEKIKQLVLKTSSKSTIKIGAFTEVFRGLASTQFEV
jgi:hypothetical protein